MVGPLGTSRSLAEHLHLSEKMFAALANVLEDSQGGTNPTANPFSFFMTTAVGPGIRRPKQELWFGNFQPMC